MSVVNIEHYRPPGEIGPCRVTLIGFPFKTPEGQESTLSVNMTVENSGTVDALTETLRTRGGMYIPPQDGGSTFWFLPWPCAAVRICPCSDVTFGPICGRIPGIISDIGDTPSPRSDP